MSRFFAISKSLSTKLREIADAIMIAVAIIHILIRLGDKIFRFISVIYLIVVSSGNRIVTATTPGTARKKSFQSEVSPFKRTVFPDCLNTILRTGRAVSACCRQ
jgi:hypothetical protein